MCESRLDQHYCLAWHGQMTALSPAEARILVALLGAEACVVSRAQLAAIAATDIRHGLDTHMYRLRHKLRAFRGLEVETVPKRGFRLNLAGEPGDAQRLRQTLATTRE